MSDDLLNCSPSFDEDGLPLPTPFPEYVKCPNCGELEVEVWCFEVQARCHACGVLIQHQPPPCFGSQRCKGYQAL